MFEMYETVASLSDSKDHKVTVLGHTRVYTIDEPGIRCKMRLTEVLVESESEPREIEASRLEKGPEERPTTRKLTCGPLAAAALGGFLGTSQAT